MNKKPATGFAIASVLVMIGAIFSVSIRVSIAESEGRRAASADFEELKIGLGQVTKAGDLADPLLRARLTRHYAASANLLLALVIEQGRGLRWRIPDRSPYLPATENTVPNPILRRPDRSTLVLSSPLPGDSSGRLVLEALYVSIPQSAVFAAFRDSSLGLVAWLLLCLILYLALGSRAAPVEATWRVGGPAPSRSADRGFDSPADAEERPLGSGGSQSSLDSPRAEASASEDLAAKEFEIEASAMADELEPQQNEDQKPKIRAEELESSGAKTVGAEPQGLFSPLSGLGWESYLEDRLDAELSRSASFEQDLTLILVSYDGLGPGQPAYVLVAKTIEEFFSFRDLAFERGPDTFAVILPNLDADHGLRMAEEFLKKVTFVLRQKGEASPLERLPISIGLSSRAGRLVEVARLIFEAETALEKAHAETDARILAFKPDPDKYRLYMASKGL